MSYPDLLETIRELPVVDQIALAESILREAGHSLSHYSQKSGAEREIMRKLMREAAQDAMNYYRHDPDVALWRYASLTSPSLV